MTLKLTKSTQRKSMLWPLAVGVLLIIGDQLSKLWVVKTIKPIHSVSVIPGLLSFTYVENRGAAFGIFQGRTALLGVISVGLLIWLVVQLIKGTFQSPFLSWVMVLIVSGGFGNVIDRFGRGYVVDFFDVTWGPLQRFPVFNVADIYITVGAALMILYIVRHYDELDEQQEDRPKDSE